MDKRLLEILCCPVTKMPLRELANDELVAINDAIASDQVVDGAGRKVGGALAAGLITRDAKSIYRIEEDIPVMLADESIAVAGVPGFPSAR